jgi:hypothetical protein
MSNHNSGTMKRVRRVQRLNHRLATKNVMHFDGLKIDRRSIKTQQYLRDHGLPHSPKIAAVA